MVVGIAKDIGENKNGISRGENQVDNELTFVANKKREYFSQVDAHGHMIKNSNKFIPDLSVLQTQGVSDFYDQLNHLVARQKFNRHQIKALQSKAGKGGKFPNLEELN